MKAVSKGGPPMLVGPRVWGRRLGIGLRQLLLAARNRFGRRSVLGDAHVVVSLTTHGARIRSVHYAIESIARGVERPARLILWVDHELDRSRFPAALRRLQARGLEILGTEDFGPHTKYYPYVRSIDDHAVALVTADDDTLYPRTWLRQLVTAYEERPDVVSCLRAHVVGLAGDRIAPYATWRPCQGPEPHVRNFATGVSGVIYPPGLLDQLRRSGEGFRAACQAADDVWLHLAALRHQFRIRQVGRSPQEFPTTLRSQASSLRDGNVTGGRNDRIIAEAYGPADLARLLSE
ncbi:hypothetical protein [Georgenia sp. SYP-B2076]|uniref:hypothetical protein n=1 Tax=Georgenia sp. SYP-B2076 TaxID=2495881 RepID=UPI000F8D25E9|nr:hypothetical protein [Georgenia sp. SYP-B2076]